MVAESGTVVQLKKGQSRYLESPLSMVLRHQPLLIFVITRNVYGLDDHIFSSSGCEICPKD